MKRPSIIITAATLALLGCAQPAPTAAEKARVAQQVNSSSLVQSCAPQPAIPDAVLADPRFQRATATVRFTLLPNGKARDVTLVKSSGRPDLDAAAVQGVEGWQCQIPFLLLSTTVVTVPLNFFRGEGAMRDDYFELTWRGTYVVDNPRRVDDPSKLTGKRTLFSAIHKLESTDQIIARIGTRFGISFKFKGIDGETPSGAVTNYRSVWRPPAPGLTNPVTRQTVTESVRTSTCKDQRECQYFWSFDEPWEQIPGAWTLEIWVRDVLITSQTFQVSLPAAGEASAGQ